MDTRQMHRRDASTFISHEFYLTQDTLLRKWRKTQRSCKTKILFCCVEQKEVTVKKELHYVGRLRRMRIVFNKIYLYRILFYSQFSALDNINVILLPVDKGNIPWECGRRCSLLLSGRMLRPKYFRDKRMMTKRSTITEKEGFNHHQEVNLQA